MSTVINSHVLPSGFQLHWYRIVRVISEGGFGITYLARDENLDSPVAVKEYLPADVAVRASDATVHARSDTTAANFQWGLTRFLNEARVLSRLDHPNIVRVHSVFEGNGTAYIVMRYEAGSDLNRLLADVGTLPQNCLLEILLPVLDGLERVHQAGYLHRDIKPGNIIIRDDGTPVLIDFGSARRSAGVDGLVTSLVTFGYSPLEQFSDDSRHQGPWTDIYALGATLYHAVLGAKPAPADRRTIEQGTGTDTTINSLMAATEHGYTESFLDAIAWALHTGIKDRPQSVAEWRQRLLAETGADTSAALPREPVSGPASDPAPGPGALRPIAPLAPIFDDATVLHARPPRPAALLASASSSSEPSAALALLAADDATVLAPPRAARASADAPTTSGARPPRVPATFYQSTTCVQAVTASGAGLLDAVASQPRAAQAESGPGTATGPNGLLSAKSADLDVTVEVADDVLEIEALALGESADATVVTTTAPVSGSPAKTAKTHNGLLAGVTISFALTAVGGVAYLYFHGNSSLTAREAPVQVTATGRSAIQRASSDAATPAASAEPAVSAAGQDDADLDTGPVAAPDTSVAASSLEPSNGEPEPTLTADASANGTATATSVEPLLDLAAPSVSAITTSAGEVTTVSTGTDGSGETWTSGPLLADNAPRSREDVQSTPAPTIDTGIVRPDPAADFETDVESESSDLKSAVATAIAEVTTDSERRAAVTRVKAPVAPVRPVSLAALAADRDTRRVASLMAQAREAVKARHFTQPADKSAVTYYRKVLKLQPRNRDAQRGLEDISRVFISWGLKSVRRNNPPKANERLVRARLSWPGNPRLGELAAAIETLTAPKAAPGNLAPKRLFDPEIAALLAEANRAEVAGNLAQARGIYRKMLVRDRSNSSARIGLRSVAARYVRRAEGLIERNNLEGARRALNAAGSAFPSLPDIARVRDVISKRGS